MKFSRLSLTLPLVCFGLASCDQAKDLVRQVSSAVTRNLHHKVGPAEAATVDRSLESLVDQTAEGYLFRTDLAFPARVSQETRMQRQISGRFFHASELGRKVENVKGTEQTVLRMTLDQDKLNYQLVESVFSVPSIEKSGNKPVMQRAQHPMRQIEPSTEPLEFQRVGGSWNSAGAGGFRSMVLARDLAPVFDDLLVENALAPRPYWFAAKKRLKIGDELDVTGAMIGMLVAGKAAEGKLRLRFEAVEAVNGHPCGVFHVLGDYRRKAFPDFEGQLVDQEVTIESGRMWLSLLYPLVLKQELQTIESLRLAGSGGMIGRSEGVVHVTVSRDWVAMPAGR